MLRGGASKIRGYVRIDNSTSDGSSLFQAELLRRLLGQTLADRLSCREDQAVLARDTADLRKVALDLRVRSAG